jgi:hypothetical protein
MVESRQSKRKLSAASKDLIEEPKSKRQKLNSNTEGFVNVNIAEQKQREANGEEVNV